ncbi:MAG: carbohydrate kinase family protein [Actinomycetota bacterium]
MNSANEAPRVVVIGGANVDIQGRVSSAALVGESNPGRVTRSAGGVGRNVAHRLALIGVDTTLITAIGDDEDGRWLASVTSDAGVDLGRVIWSQQRTATYLAVLDENGEMVLAVSDMAVLTDLDVGAIEARAAIVDAADAVVVDCNLDESTLGAVAGRGRPLFVDPVSAAKAPRIDGVLDRVHTIKPNVAELAALTGRAVETDAAIEAAATSLVDRGVDRVVVSLGRHGVVVVDSSGAIARHASTASGSVASVTGAGDALLAGLVAAHVRGDDPATAVQTALDVAADAITSTGAVAD